MVAQKNFRTSSFVADKAFKAPVILVTTLNVATLSGAQTIETVVLAIGDRVLLNAQTDPADNGIYTVEQAAWNRAGDWDGNRDATNGTVIISTQSGAVELWELQTVNDPFEPGTHDATFVLVDLAPSFQFLTADDTETTTTLKSPFTAVALEVDKFYQVEAFLIMHSNDLGQAPNAALRMDYSAAFTAIAGSILYHAGGATPVGISQAIDSTDSGIVMTTGGAGNSVLVRMSYVLNTNAGAAGNLQPQYAVGSGSSGSPIVTIKAGSWFRVREMG